MIKNAHFIWTGFRPAWVDRHLALWKKALHGWNVIEWDEASLGDAYPADLVTDDGAEFRKTNLARIRVLNEHGGLYLDIDSIPTTNDFPLEEPATGYASFYWSPIKAPGQISRSGPHGARRHYDHCLIYSVPGLPKEAGILDLAHNQLSFGLSQLEEEGRVDVTGLHHDKWFTTPRVPGDGEPHLWVAPLLEGQRWPKDTHAVHLRQGCKWANPNTVRMFRQHAYGRRVLGIGADSLAYELEGLTSDYLVLEGRPYWSEILTKVGVPHLQHFDLEWAIKEFNPDVIYVKAPPTLREEFEEELQRLVRPGTLVYQLFPKVVRVYRA